MFQVGDRLHNQRYEILSPLGQGGFSQTFEVDDGGTVKVLKVLSESYPKAVDLFQREFKVLSQLRHPGIPLVEKDGYFMVPPVAIAIADQAAAGDPHDPYHCLIMERIPGVDLRQWLRQRDHEPIGEETALGWLTQLTEILRQLHQHHCFHRDIKPSNIMLRPDGQLVLIDFGAVREVTETFLHKQEDDVTSTHLYSRGYTPMEQMQGRAVPQSDFYALGRTFVHLLTGSNPLDFATDFETGDLLWRDHAPHISGALADLIDRLMAPFVASRPPDPDCLMAEIAVAQEKIVNHETPLVGDGEGHKRSTSASAREDVGTEMPSEFLTDSGSAPKSLTGVGATFNTDKPSVATASLTVASTQPLPLSTLSLKKKLGLAWACSFLATTGIMGIRLLGLLQGLELSIFDQMMRSRMAEPLDPRMVLITVDNEDIVYQDQRGFERQGSLSDEALAQLLSKLEPHSPRVIGIDIYLPPKPNAPSGARDHSQTPNRSENSRSGPTLSGNIANQDVVLRDSFRDVFRRSETLVAVCAVGGGQQEQPAIAPPAEVPLERVGFSNMPYDADQRVRRQLLGMTPDQVCDTSQALSTQLVTGYLASENLESGFSDQGVVFIGDRPLTPINGRIGGYQHPSMLGDGGYQLLLNYRANPELAPTYGLSTILSGDLDDQLSDIVADQMVLVGTTERSYNDYHLTPYGELPGVVIQGHMTSQILAAVLDDRPLLWGFPLWGDGIWILAWSGLMGGAFVLVRSPWLKIGMVIVIVGSLVGISFILLLYGGWMPLVPSIGAIALTGLGLKYCPQLLPPALRRLSKS